MSERQRVKGEIFLADDDPALRDALSVTFMLEGFHARSFADGASFLAVARESIPDAILLDVKMPGPSGIDILHELHAHRVVRRACFLILNRYGMDCRGDGI